MTPDRDFERILNRWFAEGPTEVPDRVIDTVVDRIRRQRQRPAWRLLWRNHPMNGTLKLAAAAAAAIVVAVVGMAVVGRQPGSNVGGPRATPAPIASPSPTPGTSMSPSPTPCPTSEPACIGALDPGTHSTVALITPITYTVPAGWSKPLDVPGSVNLTPDEQVGIIGIWPDWNIAKQDSCAMVRDAEPGMGRTPDDLVGWLTAYEGLATSSPAPVTLGGFEGLVLDVELKPGWTGSCARRAYLFTHKGTIGDDGGLEVRSKDRMRLAFVDVGRGHVVNVAIVVEDSADFESFVAAATPVVDSIVFE